MELINIRAVRFIKDRKHSWRVIDNQGNEVFKSEPHTKKDAVKTIITFANKAYNLGFSAGHKAGQTQLKVEILKLLEEDLTGNKHGQP